MRYDNKNTMATTGKIFYNAVRSMSRLELLMYISKYAEKVELEVLLNTFDELRKGSVLNDEMNDALNEAKEQVSKVERNPDDVTLREYYLNMLEGQILMLMLSRHLAKNLNKKEQERASNRKLNLIFSEYKTLGGNRSFRSPHMY